MQLRTFKRHHKWLGLILSLFLILFSLSGIVLNHRSLVANAALSRRYLPSEYHFSAWNNGLLRGTITLDDSTGILAYGTAGVWLTDSMGNIWQAYNKGLPDGADHKTIRRVLQTESGTVFACTPFAVYRLVEGEWHAIPLPMSEIHEDLVDLAYGRDTLVVVGRSHLYVAAPPYTTFRVVTLLPSDTHDYRVSLFRTIWLLHSGELFGLVGKVLIDLLGVLMVVLVVTGVMHWFFPKWIRHLRHRVEQRKQATQQMLRNFRLHNRLGKYTIGAMIFVVFTGWCLRPPLLIALAQWQVPVIPYTLLDRPGNAWHDRLRTLRYDVYSHTWLLNTSVGFYESPTLASVPKRLPHTPPISVMGINAMEQRTDGTWVVGSFAGIYTWNRVLGQVRDYYTQLPPKEQSGPPIGQNICAGYSDDFVQGELVVLYDKGSSLLPMPDEMRYLPMSLWHMALEVHTGRIYTFLGIGKHFVVFAIGLATLWCLWAGYRVRHRRQTK